MHVFNTDERKVRVQLLQDGQKSLSFTIYDADIKDVLQIIKDALSKAS